MGKRKVQVLGKPASAGETPEKLKTPENMKITKATYTVGGIGRAVRALVNIERQDDSVIVTRSHKPLRTFEAADFNNLTYAEFITKNHGFAEFANAFYGERVTNSMISDLYDELSKFA